MAGVLAVGALACGVLSLSPAPGRAVANTPTTKAVSIRMPVPESLSTLESSAEDIVDYALAADRPTAIVEGAKLKAAATGPAATALTKAGVPAQQVVQLKLRASRVVQLARNGPFIEIALAANAVSQLLADFYGRFQDRVPAQVLALDYDDREAQLRSLAHQPAKVTIAVQLLEKTWRALRQRVVGAGGVKEAAAFDRHVAAMKRLRPNAGKPLQAEAVRGLELVDALEQVFD